MADFVADKEETPKAFKLCRHQMTSNRLRVVGGFNTYTHAGWYARRFNERAVRSGRSHRYIRRKKMDFLEPASETFPSHCIDIEVSRDRRYGWGRFQQRHSAARTKDVASFGQMLRNKDGPQVRCLGRSPFETPRESRRFWLYIKVTATLFSGSQKRLCDYDPEQKRQQMRGYHLCNRERSSRQPWNHPKALGRLMVQSHASCFNFQLPFYYDTKRLQKHTLPDSGAPPQ
ncbi:hypothetical protein J3F83DRAFT_334378 [Trichoderma novae-zelandiae]